MNFQDIEKILEAQNKQLEKVVGMLEEILGIWKKNVNECKTILDRLTKEV